MGFSDELTRLDLLSREHRIQLFPCVVVRGKIGIGEALGASSEAAWGIPPKGGDSVKGIIKLVRALTTLIRALADLIRLFL